ncbi:SpoIIE family protein phosphatase [Saccharospirillum mangrovi]|uniref:SpoIIE family protein phosphatase n=1 Tax=Saccharospirillum mangrovi TaxID=2161747 RepID=UPI0013B35F40|nr:SpoIIE family protein phosphatase [Saccharospirillum mangrovi]
MPITDAKLLVVDDDQAVRDSIVAYLEDSGYSVLEADNGEAALALFEQEALDLVICDLRMPVMDGLTLLRRIMEVTDEVPVIVVSGAGVMSDVVDALRLGASDYLMKPVVDLGVLEHSVERALERSLLVRENYRYRVELEARNQELQNHVDRLKLDLQAGRAVQQRLLPEKPLERGGFRINHRMVPSNYLSGDLVDYFPIPNNRLVFYVADVSGHGASSALITLLIKNQIDRLRDEIDNGSSDVVVHPAQVLALINQELLKTQTGKHATVFYGVLDTEKCILHYASAAHFPAPILGAQQSVRTLDPENLAVGLFENVEFNEHELSLDGFERLSVMSDGVLELLDDASLQEKEAHLLELGADASHTMLQFLAQMTERGKTQAVPDDITVLTVENSVNGRKSA